MVIDSLLKSLALRKWGKSILCQGVSCFDSLVCTGGNVCRQSVRSVRASQRQFSVAIAHYNRGALIHRALFNLLDHPAVAEVVIVDDGSATAQYSALEHAVAKIPGRERIRLHRRENNCGALVSKGEAVERAASDWVLVLDSDNTAFRGYLNSFAAMQEPSADSFFCAAWAFPFFAFHALEGCRLDLPACAQATRSGLLRSTYILNDGNYFVPREKYVSIVQSLAGTGRDGADVMLVNYRWMTCGGAIEVLPGTSYVHRLDPGSLYKSTEGESRARILDMLSRLEKNLPCDEAYIAALREAGEVQR